MTCFICQTFNINNEIINIKGSILNMKLIYLNIKRREV